jgi:hypothetical protein
MDISQFVSETIKQICTGIKEAKEACKEENDPVAPVAIKGIRLDESVQMIHFDICAVATEEKKGGGRNQYSNTNNNKWRNRQKYKCTNFVYSEDSILNSIYPFCMFFRKRNGSFSRGP